VAQPIHSGFDRMFLGVVAGIMTWYILDTGQRRDSQDNHHAFVRPQPVPHRVER
jgi:hypothetical protein